MFGRSSTIDGRGGEVLGRVRAATSAVFVAAERQQSSFEFITLDDRLATAARKEGLSSEAEISGASPSPAFAGGKKAIGLFTRAARSRLVP